MSAATRSARTRRTTAPDRLCADAVALAREAVETAAGPGEVGAYLEAIADGDRVVTHLFECLEPAYRGWRWAATVTRASRAKSVTLDETVLLPGPDALLAPEWVPWSERLLPGDLGPGDLLPTESEDLRLEPGYAGGELRPPKSPVVEDEAEPLAELAGTSGSAGGTSESAGRAEEEGADLEADARGAGAVAEAAPGPVPERGMITAVAEELGMARSRVLSRYGLHSAADRWEDEYGARTPMAQSAPASCMTCGFLVPLVGSLRQAFGVCANEYSPADGHVVSLSYGCGGHSEAAVMPKPQQPPPPVIDETRADELS
jgi:Protein of unknown function (DUF3027)